MMVKRSQYIKEKSETKHIQNNVCLWKKKRGAQKKDQSMFIKITRANFSSRTKEDFLLCAFTVASNFSAIKAEIHNSSFTIEKTKKF